MNILFQAHRDHPLVAAGFDVYPNTMKVVQAAPILWSHIVGRNLEEAKQILKHLGYNRLVRLTPEVGYKTIEL